MEAAPRSERVSLSRDLSEFLIELSIALHRHSMYPSGHPALVPAIESVTRRAEKLLQDRPQIAFGVARRQLIIDGVTTDPEQPVLRRLADGLHRHHIGAVSIMRGVESPGARRSAACALGRARSRRSHRSQEDGGHLAARQSASAHVRRSGARRRRAGRRWRSGRRAGLARRRVVDRPGQGRARLGRDRRSAGVVRALRRSPRRSTRTAAAPKPTTRSSSDTSCRSRAS